MSTFFINVIVLYFFCSGIVFPIYLLVDYLQNREMKLRQWAWEKALTASHPSTSIDTYNVYAKSAYLFATSKG